jgi:hypothetical protein
LFLSVVNAISRDAPDIAGLVEYQAGIEERTISIHKISKKISS